MKEGKTTIKKKLNNKDNFMYYIINAGSSEIFLELLIEAEI
jgi:hypothetical protein